MIDYTPYTQQLVRWYFNKYNILPSSLFRILSVRRKKDTEGLKFPSHINKCNEWHPHHGKSADGYEQMNHKDKFVEYQIDHINQREKKHKESSIRQKYIQLDNVSLHLSEITLRGVERVGGGVWALLYRLRCLLLLIWTSSSVLPTTGPSTLARLLLNTSDNYVEHFVIKC